MTAPWLLQVSLILNLLVLIPVCASIILSAPWVVTAFGESTPSRGILLSIYLAILVVSVGLLFHPAPQMAVALLVVQIVYKLSTPITVRTLRNPVVLSNLAIAALHTLTVTQLWPSGVI